MINKSVLVSLLATILWQGQIPNSTSTNYPGRTYRVVKTDKGVVAEMRVNSTDAMGVSTTLWIDTEDSFRDADIFKQALMEVK